MLVRRITDAPPVIRLRDEVDRLFERFFGDYEPFRAWDRLGLRRFPAVNVWQNDNDIFVEAELPGLTEKDIDVTVAGNELTIKGERAGLEPARGETLHRRERSSGTFSRVIHLPVDVNDDKVAAAFRNGVLTVTLAKADVARSRHIPVKTTEPRRPATRATSAAGRNRK